MLIKTEALEGIALAFAVALAEGRARTIRMNSGIPVYSLAYVKHPDGPQVRLDKAQFLFDFDSGGYYHPHESWGIGGPIIEREGIELHRAAERGPYAQTYDMRLAADGKSKHYHRQFGDTVLIAAMRTYVYLKLGAEVDIPEVLP